MAATILLNGILQKEKTRYPTGISDDDLFELYCADNLLVNYDLDNAEIQDGIIDGPRDAGIDAAYVLVNGIIVTEDFDFNIVRQPVELEFVIIQTKNQDNFKEGPVDKLASSLPLLLDPSKKASDLEPLFKKEVVAVCQKFLTTLSTLADKFPKVTIRLFYCCKGNEPNDTTKAKATGVEGTVKGMGFGNVQFVFLGAQQLYDRSGLQKRLVAKLTTAGSPLSGSNSFVALCKLTDYLKFITDGVGNLMTPIFEANVRAYQGEVEVNKEIAASLKSPTAGVDFWWLNNGVTIVADEAAFTNNQLVIANPLIVNGLQTSHEVHAYSASLKADDARAILIRVVVETDPTKRDEIIRATNRQTSISNSSFRATEQTHREIEDYLLTLGYFYDRRKNAYKREGKPADKIIGIDRLAQGVLAVLLQEPHTARARPTTAIKSEPNYKKIFSGDKNQHPLEMYGVLTALLGIVEPWFRGQAGKIDQVYRNNLKFHALMVLAWALNGGQTMPAPAICKLDVKKATDAQMDAVCKWLFDEFKSAGPEDKTAKDSGFTARLQKNWTPAKTKP
ncbi:MAG: AIPR family protein [Pseudomonadota bacterium]